MKRVDICFEVDKACKKGKESIEKISRLVLGDEIEFLFLEIDCKEIESRDSMYSFLKWLKSYTDDIAKEYNALIRCSAIINLNVINSKISGVMNRWLSSVKITDNPSMDLMIQAANLLKKRRIDYSVLINGTELEEIEKRYLYYKNISIPVSVPNNYSNFGEEIIPFFINWAYDVNGSDINLFSNIATSVLLDYEGDSCIHNSCLGKILNVSSEGNIYFCKYHREISYLAKIGEINSLKDIYSKGSFISIIQTGIGIRKNCAKNCNAFLFCHSGCPLVKKEDSLCSERLYMQFYIKAADEIIKIANNADYSKVNPYLRLKLLSAIASGNGHKYKEAVLINENT